ncbi:MAG: septum formation initiator family protein [Candidatus Staskawiczbacteria bacterium]|nr:septum formation initiator family protein [Candidatus Staskawiczbacteria bacterium]
MISNFKKKQKSDTPYNFLSSTLIKFLFLIVIVFLIFADVRVYKEKGKLNSQVNNLKEKIQAIQQKNDELKKGINNADDQSYIEKIAREELDLQKSEEKVISFIMPEKTVSKEINDNNNFLNIKTWTGWLSNGWQWIKNKF